MKHDNYVLVTVPTLTAYAIVEVVAKIEDTPIFLHPWVDRACFFEGLCGKRD